PVGRGLVPHRAALVPVFLVFALMACAQPASQGSSGSANPAPLARKLITAGINSQPIGFFQEITNPTGAPASVPGLQETYQLVNNSLTYMDRQSVRYAHLADAVPSVDNGQGKVAADGRMETTGRIKQGTRWHD